MTESAASNYYIPKTITIGQFGNSAFVTCKFKGTKWIAPSIFERLCNFKPHAQRDSVKQLKKIITNAVVELPNDPIEGFKFISSNADIYKMKNSWKDRGDVILQDPRGFDIGLPEEFFWNMLRSNGCNIKDSVIVGRYAYMWNQYSNRFELVNADTAEYAQCLAASKDIAKVVDTTEYLKPSQLEVGKTYLHTNGEAWMYVGIHDTYSAKCHLDAFDAKTYAYVLDELIADRTDLTTTGKMVFYNTDAKYEDFLHIKSKITNQLTAPYIARSCTSKMFLKEIPDSDIANKRMFNSSKLCTYQNVKDDMRTSLFFNKIDFSTGTTEKEPLSLSNFTTQFGLKSSNYRHQHTIADYADFPFDGFDRCNILDTQNFGHILLRASYSGSNSCYQRFFMQNISHNSALRSAAFYSNEKVLDCTIDECYDKLKPLASVFYLENGEKIAQGIARCLYPANERRCR